MGRAAARPHPDLGQRQTHRRRHDPHRHAELLALSGPRNPYQQGPLGVIKEGAYADLILVNGNPLEDLDLVADAANNFLIIMKDGKIYKNTLND